LRAAIAANSGAAMLANRQAITSFQMSPPRPSGSATTLGIPPYRTAKAGVRDGSRPGSQISA
jgi:hypothetical protein